MAGTHGEQLSNTHRSSSGYSSWRLIAEELRADIGADAFTDGRLPTEAVLAARFDVNRHTVRQAIASLAEDGLVESRRGSGTFVVGTTLQHHLIGLRTRFSRSFGDEPTKRGRVISTRTESASHDVREALHLTGDTVVRVETVGAGTSSTHFYDAERFKGIGAVQRRTRSVTLSFREFGIDDYVRAATSITARHATVAEAQAMDLDPGAILLVSRAVDALPDGTPIQVVVTRLDAARFALDVTP